MRTNEQIIKDTIQTTSLSNGLLNPEQARKFIQQTFEATNLGPLLRHEMRTARTGEIDKIGIGRRLLRQKTENTDDNYRAGVNTGSIVYSTTAIRLPWEITEETLRENIEGSNFETITTNLMTTQLGVDLEDLYLNGDESTDPKDPDYDFLKINDGFIKQITKGGHNVKGDKGKTMANKYNNGRLRWLMSPRRSQQWELYLLNKIIEAGGAVPDSLYKSPAGIPTVSCPSLSDGVILLTDPKNLIVVNTYSMQIRKTTEGKEAIMQDKRFYVVHLDYDCIIEEPDATAIITDLPDIEAAAEG